MRLLADEHIPRMLVDRLKADGHDITWIALTAPGAIDEEVLSIVFSDLIP